MLTTRIAAGATAVVLGISGVALANADLSGEVQTEAHTEVSTPAASADLGAETETDATVSVSSSPTTLDDHPGTTTEDSTPTTVDDHPNTTTEDSTPTTVDDHHGTEDGEEHETRAIVSLGLSTYTAADAGTVSVDGMALIAIDPNPGWTVEIDEASSDRIRIEFENGERNVEFELRVDGELRIKSGD